MRENITSVTSFLIAHCGSMLSDEEGLQNKASYIVTCQHIIIGHSLKQGDWKCCSTKPNFT